MWVMWKHFYCQSYIFEMIWYFYCPGSRRQFVNASNTFNTFFITTFWAMFDVIHGFEITQLNQKECSEMCNNPCDPPIHRSAGALTLSIVNVHNPMTSAALHWKCSTRFKFWAISSWLFFSKYAHNITGAHNFAYVARMSTL